MSNVRSDTLDTQASSVPSLLLNPNPDDDIQPLSVHISDNKVEGKLTEFLRRWLSNQYSVVAFEHKGWQIGPNANMATSDSDTGLDHDFDEPINGDVHSLPCLQNNDPGSNDCCWLTNSSSPCKVIPTFSLGGLKMKRKYLEGRENSLGGKIRLGKTWKNSEAQVVVPTEPDGIQINWYSNEEHWKSGWLSLGRCRCSAWEDDRKEEDTTEMEESPKEVEESPEESEKPVSYIEAEVVVQFVCQPPANPVAEGPSTPRGDGDIEVCIESPAAMETEQMSE